MRIGISTRVTRLNFLATPIQHDMIDCNGIKAFLFDLKRHQNRWRLGLRPRPSLDGGTHRVLHTVGEDEKERRNEFSSNLKFLATQLWQITIAPKASILI